MSDPNYNQDPMIGLHSQNTLRRRFADVASLLDEQKFGGTFDNDGRQVIDSVEVIKAARFQFNEGSAVVSISQTLGLGYRQAEDKVTYYGKPSKNETGEYVRTSETYARESFESYDSDSPSDELASVTQHEYIYSRKVQRWADSEGVWEDVSIDDGLKSIDEDGFVVYDFNFGPKEFRSVMRIFDRISSSRKILLQDAPPIQ